MDYRKLLDPPDEDSFSIEDVQEAAGQLVEAALARMKARPGRGRRTTKKSAKRTVRKTARKPR